MNDPPVLLPAAGPASADVLAAGCTPGGDGTHPVDLADASPVVGRTGGSTIAVPLDTTLEPDEHPSTGCPWNLTAAPGLREVPGTCARPRETPGPRTRPARPCPARSR